MVEEKSGELVESLLRKREDPDTLLIPEKGSREHVFSEKVETEDLWTVRNVSQRRALLLMTQEDQI